MTTAVPSTGAATHAYGAVVRRGPLSHFADPVQQELVRRQRRRELLLDLPEQLAP